MPCVDKFLSDLLFGYRRAIVLRLYWFQCQKNEDIYQIKKYAGAILINLSKAFDTINHELLLAKMHTQCSSNDLLLIILRGMSNRNQRVKINNTLSSQTDLIQGVLQGSVLGLCYSAIIQIFIYFSHLIILMFVI